MSMLRVVTKAALPLRATLTTAQRRRAGGGGDVGGRGGGGGGRGRGGGRGGRIPMMETVSREEAESYLGPEKAAALPAEPTVRIGIVAADGSINTQSDAKYFSSVQAVWNPSSRRVELIREDGGSRIRAWVKGAQYMQGHLSKIDPLASFWDAERINNNGGVMVMEQLGRIPGEAAKQKTLREAVEHMLNHDVHAPVGSGTSPWAEQTKLSDELEVKRLQQMKVVILVACLALTAQMWYILREATMEVDRKTGHRVTSGPSLNK